MTTTTNEPSTATPQGTRDNLPTHVVKIRKGYGKQTTYERVGAAWLNDSGALYVKLCGTQIIEAMTLYPISSADQPGD